MRLTSTVLVGIPRTSPGMTGKLACPCLQVKPVSHGLDPAMTLNFRLECQCQQRLVSERAHNHHDDDDGHQDRRHFVGNTIEALRSCVAVLEEVAAPAG